jgi:hypothetical protein
MRSDGWMWACRKLFSWVTTRRNPNCRRRCRRLRIGRRPLLAHDPLRMRRHRRRGTARSSRPLRACTCGPVDAPDAASRGPSQSAEGVGDLRRIQCPGADAVDPDAGGSELQRRGARDSHHAVLGGVVGRQSLAAADSRHRRGIDDRAALLRDHHAAGELQSPTDAGPDLFWGVEIEVFRGFE